MINKPLVSVIIATFQRAQFLNRALDSVIQQTYKNLEIIIVDDNDGDNEFRKDTENNLEEYISNKQIDYLKHQKNKGLSAARNTGIKHANGEFIAFLDDDDEWLPQKIEKQIELFKKLSSDYGVVGSNWKIINDFEHKETYRGLKHRGDLSKILAVNHFSPPSMIMVKTKYLNQIDGFDENFRWREDIELYYRLSFICKFDFVEEPLVNYYQHSGALSTNFEKKLEGVIQYLKKHQLSIIKNKLPWSEINEFLGELYAVNGNKRKALRHLFIAFKHRPLVLTLIAKSLAVAYYNKDQYKKFRNFK